MGTRHWQSVIDKEGNLKLANYGQWDGYPDGQGKNILNYLRNGDLEKYYENVVKLREVTNEEGEQIDKNENWKVDFFYLSRDCGSDIHQMIEDGKVKFINWCDRSEADQWCGGFYTIDFQKRQFICEYGGYGQDKPAKVFDLDNLPTEEEFLSVWLSEEELAEQELLRVEEEELQKRIDWERENMV